MSDLIGQKTFRHESVEAVGSIEYNGELQPLLLANIVALGESKNVLTSLSDEQYTASCKPVFLATLGAHFRHLIEHYVCFVQQAAAETHSSLASDLSREKLATKLVCYDSRRRDHQIEQDREYAVAVLDQVIDQLRDFSNFTPSSSQLMVRDQEGLAPIQTNTARELLFLQSHTVHHHAIIAAMCRLLEHPIPSNFGVAIATKHFQAAQESRSQNTADISSVKGDS